MTNQERRERWAVYGGWEKARTLEDVEEAPERSGARCPPQNPSDGRTEAVVAQVA